MDEFAGLGPALDDVDVLVGAGHVVSLLAMLLDAILSHVLKKGIMCQVFNYFCTLALVELSGKL